ncbi:Cyanobacteria-specific chaperone containing DNAJ domain fused to a membrane domain [Prochlorococcus sp. SS52]|uniref:CPP1-like family protein n=1 Tax=Prochlorococcus sp. SS52 TaxID=1499501 RepID=UPI0005339F08|nr:MULTISPECIES: CPP1-like family protein [Prochlorococcus]KGG36376.1 Cyanobacteria-specific chaperone containing DNAJ domain fused to a membrane domain [Prochlorococcus sp. SS52]
MSDTDLSSQEGGNDPYSLLGVSPDSSFEEIQEARDRKLSQAGEDLLLKAKIESCYDALLMNSLKARRLGNVSSEAVNASQKEKNGANSGKPLFGSALLTRFNALKSSTNGKSTNNTQPNFNLPEGEGLTIRVSLGLLVIVLLLVAPDSNIQLILSLSTIGLFVSQIKRGRKTLQSLGWSVVFLSIGYILGGLIVSNLTGISDQTLLISINKLEALPALLMLWIGALLLG